jgi:protein-S-isoprenylcysteine O-methyltransferase Ste14
MNEHPNKTDHPGIYIPPPLIYAGLFLLAYLLQRMAPINAAFFYTTAASIAGVLMLLLALVILVTSLRQFVRSRNTLVTIKPATSLQTEGIYRFTRNPMYIGLATLYTALAFLLGNWWHFLLLPLLLLIVQEYIIKREERYLVRQFKDDYIYYRQRVRRWI